MDDPKSEVYTKLKEIENITVDEEVKDVNVYLERPEVLTELVPCITFSVNNNVPEYELDKDIAKQDIQMKVDLWAVSSIETGLLLDAVEEKMRELNYLLVFNRDVPDPTGFHHITTQFNY